MKLKEQFKRCDSVPTFIARFMGPWNLTLIRNLNKYGVELFFQSDDDGFLFLI